MSSKPVSIQSFNYFISDYYHGKQTPLEAFDTKILHYQFDSIALSVLEKICYVALVAIGATILVSSFNLVALNITLWEMAKLLLTSSILAIASQKFIEWSQYRSELTHAESKVKHEFERICNWRTSNIEAFLNRQQLKISNDSINALKFINSEEPLKPLLPLIARLYATRNELTKISRRMKSLMLQLNEQENQIQERGESPGQQMISDYAKLNKIIETETFPNILRITTLAHIIENPTNRDLDVIPNSLLIPGLGECVPKSLDERYPKNPESVKPQDSDYFIFYDPQRKPLTIKDISKKHSQFRYLLFPRESVN